MKDYAIISIEKHTDTDGVVFYVANTECGCEILTGYVNGRHEVSISGNEYRSYTSDDTGDAALVCERFAKLFAEYFAAPHVYPITERE